MIGYITLGTSDIRRGSAFYDAIAKDIETPRMMGTKTAALSHVRIVSEH